jgi:MYXO-CTERM domain-containing protein
MLRTPQRYAEMVTSTLEFAGDLTAPVVIVTPHGIGVGGREGARFVGPRRGRALARGVELAPAPDADEMARAAMRTVRRIARTGGHPLPADVPPAQVVVSRAPARDAGASSTGDDGGSAPWIPLAAAAGAIAIGAALLRRRKVSVR